MAKRSTPSLSKELPGIENAIEKAWVKAVDAVRDDTSASDIVRALESGDTQGAIDAVSLESGDAILSDLLPDHIRDAYEAGAVSARTALADTLDTAAVNIKFDIVNQDAVDYVSERGASLIQEFGNSSESAIRSIIRGGVSGGYTPREMATQIMDSGIGLTERQAASVSNFRTGLEADANNTTAQIDSKTAAYADRVLKQRAELIARTETMTASNSGNKGLWSQAADQGLIDRSKAVMQWVATGDPCDDCDDMDGDTVGIDEDFEEGPALHPACRCIVQLLPDGE